LYNRLWNHAFDIIVCNKNGLYGTVEFLSPLCDTEKKINPVSSQFWID